MCSPGFPSISSACFWEQGLGPIPVWADASVLAFLRLHVTAFSQAIKPKADNKPNFDGALR